MSQRSNRLDPKKLQGSGLQGTDEFGGQKKYNHLLKNWLKHIQDHNKRQRKADV